jgi:hypothetical protein
MEKRLTKIQQEQREKIERNDWGDQMVVHVIWQSSY